MIYNWQSCLFGATFLIFFFLIAFALYKFIRPWFPVQVECWFCQHVTKIPYNYYNRWDCPECDQYNGFNQDGDYNKPISAQRNIDLNPSPNTSERCKDSYNSGSDLLCQTCERNQVLKIRNLAHFVPYSEANFEHEVETYKANLEEVYKLCYGCELRVQRHLGEQDRLLAQKLEHVIRQSPPRSNNHEKVVANDCQQHAICRHSTPWHIYLLHLGSLLASVTLVSGSAVHFVKHSQMHIDFSAYLGDYGVWYIEGVYSNAIPTILIGLLTKTAASTALFLCKDYSVTWSDMVSLVTWLGCLLAFSDKVQRMAPSDQFFLQTWIAFLTTVLQLYVTVVYRQAPPRKRQFVRKTLHRRNVSSASQDSPPAGVRYSISPEERQPSSSSSTAPKHGHPDHTFSRFGGLSIGQRYAAADDMTGGVFGQYQPVHARQGRNQAELQQRGSLLSAPRFSPDTLMSHPPANISGTNKHVVSSVHKSSVISEGASRSPGSGPITHDDSASEGSDDGSEVESDEEPHCHVDSTRPNRKAFQSLIQRAALGVLLGLIISLIIFCLTDLQSWTS